MINERATESAPSPRSKGDNQVDGFLEVDQETFDFGYQPWSDTGLFPSLGLLTAVVSPILAITPL